LLSYLLNIEEGNLVAIFKICGFYNKKKGFFLLAAFRTWFATTFEAKTVEMTSFRKKPLIKIDLGSHPCRSTDQLKENLDPPRFRIQTVHCSMRYLNGGPPVGTRCVYNTYPCA
jgi:hypothetical protein